MVWLGEGASVEPWPVISPVVGVKSQTGLKQHGLAASLIKRHSAGRLVYEGHLRKRRRVSKIKICTQKCHMITDFAF